MDTPIEKIYEDNVQKYQVQVDNYKHQLTLNAIGRGITFLAGIVLVYFTFRIHWAVPIIIFLISAYFFVWLVQNSARIQEKLKYFEQLVIINKRERKVLGWKYNDFDDGAEYLISDHYYQFDLDLFGKGSIFQYLNRTCTIGGKDRLAEFLSSPEQNHEEIVSKQLATVELMPLLDWRQSFQATGYIEDEQKGDRDKIKQWLNQKAFFLHKSFLRFLIYFIPVISVLLLLALFIGWITGSMFILYIMLPMSIVGIYLKRINEEQRKVSQSWLLLRKYAQLLALIESADFKSIRLGKYQYELNNEDGSASKKVEELSRIIKGLDNRNNMLVGVILDAILLWDLHYMFKLEIWRKKYAGQFDHWVELLSEFDAISCFGNFAFNNPNYVYPDINSSIKGLVVKEAGHPLLPEDRVHNDFEISKEPSFVIITGANMAGKSTFLRTIGVNMILGMAGAPVCAHRFSFAPTEVFTSMRTTDSLQKNESYFFAELSRLKQMIDKLKDGSKLFIILDEVLKGTNSKDKALGSKALVKQLINMKTTGIIATHDISLGTLIKEFPENVKNKRFEVEIVNDELVFDYKIKDGISQNLNATFLMEQMGITIN